MSLKLSLNNNAVTVTNGTDTVTFDGADVARFAEVLANPGKPVFQQDKMLFTTSVATSFGLWLLQDGRLSIFLMGKDEVLDPKVAADFAATLLGPVLIDGAVLKVGDEVQSLEHLTDMNDKEAKFPYQSYGRVVAVTPELTRKCVIYSIEVDDGTKVDILSNGTAAAYVKKAAPVQTFTVQQQMAATVVRDVTVEARSKDDAIVKAKAIRTPGIWALKNDPTSTMSMAALTTAPAIGVATPVGDIANEGWSQDRQGRIRSTDSTKFPSDTDATRFVTQRALEGSTRHQTALRKRLGV